MSAAWASSRWPCDSNFGPLAYDCGLLLPGPSYSGCFPAVLFSGSLTREAGRPFYTPLLQEAGNKAHTISQRDRSVSSRRCSRFILFVVMIDQEGVILAVIFASNSAVFSALIVNCVERTQGGISDQVREWIVWAVGVVVGPLTAPQLAAILPAPNEMTSMPTAREQEVRLCHRSSQNGPTKRHSIWSAVWPWLPSSLLC